MSIKQRILDGTGHGYEAQVTSEHALLVTAATRSAAEIPAEELTRQKVFVDFLKSGAGSRDMTVDGSTTTQEFYLASEAGSVRWIDFLRIIIEGDNFDLSASGDFRKWGSVANAPGLTNGTELVVRQGGVETPLFYDPVKNMGDLFYYQTDYNNFINAVDSQADFLSIDINMPATVALPLGVDDKILARVNDDLVDSGFMKFQILARGYLEYIE